MAQVAQAAQRRPQNIRQYTIHDDAMAPAFPAGSMVIARQIDPTHFVEWGEAYMLETVEGPILVRLTPGMDDDHYRCIRDNGERYQPIDMPKWAIKGIFRVFGSLKFM